MRIPTRDISQFINRTHTTMKTTPTRLVRFPRSAHSKAAEDRRTPKASPTRALSHHTPASWTAAVLCRFSFAVLLGALTLLGCVSRVSAQGTVPERLSFQGYMEDGSGTPLGQAAPANFEVTFRIFPAATGGTSLWTEKQTVTFDKGNYSVLLGQGTEVPPELYPTLSTVVINASGNELYVETTVTISGTPAKILPRLRLLPTPYAFLARKALVADQALSVNGSAIAVGSIPDNRLSANIVSGPIADNRLSANVTGPIADSRLSANVAMRNAANTFTANQTINGNVGIGTPAAAGKLLVNGGVRARGGAPGGGGANDNGYAFTGNGGDNDSGMFSSTDGQLQFFTDSVEQMRLAGGQVGIGTTTPGAKLDVNGSIRSTSLTVNGPFTASSFNAASITANSVNGEKPSATYSIAPGNLNLWRDVQIDGTALLGDADGGRMRIFLRHHQAREVRTVTYEFYAENDAENFGQATRYGWSINSYGAERAFRLGSGTNNDRYDIAAEWNWFWIRNYRSGVAFGGNDQAAENAGNRYRFWFMVPPQVSATVIIYDR